MNLMPLIDRLTTAGVGTPGQSLFINMIPSEAPQGVLLRNKLTGTPIDHELPGYYRSQFQVIARAPDYAAGEQLIAQAVAALTVTEEQVGPLYVRFMRPLTQPVVFPISNGNLLEFSVNFDTAYFE